MARLPYRAEHGCCLPVEVPLRGRLQIRAPGTHLRDRPFFGNRTTKWQQGSRPAEAFARLQRSDAKALVVAEALSWCAVAGATYYPLAVQRFEDRCARNRAPSSSERASSDGEKKRSAATEKKIKMFKLSYETTTVRSDRPGERPIRGEVERSRSSAEL